MLALFSKQQILRLGTELIKGSSGKADQRLKTRVSLIYFAFAEVLSAGWRSAGKCFPRCARQSLCKTTGSGQKLVFCNSPPSRPKVFKNILSKIKDGLYVLVWNRECDVLSYETLCFTVQILLSLNPAECNKVQPTMGLEDLDHASDCITSHFSHDFVLVVCATTLLSCCLTPSGNHLSVWLWHTHQHKTPPHWKIQYLSCLYEDTLWKIWIIILRGIFFPLLWK